MSSNPLTDHSPHQPTPRAPLPTATNLVLLDNYDSFTWNIYQYLVLEGASVTVLRNDAVNLTDLISLQPTQLVISPGPGHPDTDSGVSKDAIRHFSGKIPVLGVCMGEQCIFSVFGGEVDVTGEILHGKTSNLRHDGRGVYEGLGQGLPVTRYHSLAGTHRSLPACLEVSSWIAEGNGGKGDFGQVNEGKGVIMGVRHKDLLVEGVQFHPESILTADGRKMLRNFLSMQGGTWTENERLRAQTNGVHKGKEQGVLLNGTGGFHHGPTKQESNNRTAKQASILERIFEHRRHAVALQQNIPSQRFSDLQSAYDLNLAPPIISFSSRLEQSPFHLSLMAEIKRASPSKGIISLSACAPAQARTYALAGASTISVLTEPEWFKGSIDDLRTVRQVLEGMPNRPAVLRKEFIFSEYQILEARLAGADTILLIVKMLEESQLRRLHEYSKGLGMEPLVEVNTVEEMQIAARLNAQVIGVNNRNLATFDVDLNTTSRLMDAAPSNSTVCALSGISGPKDVEPYRKNGVGAVLVGEALMRAQNVTHFVSELLGGDDEKNVGSSRELLVKICGTRTPDAAKAAIESGTDLVGMILVDGSKRFVSTSTAKAISQVVHNTTRPHGSSKPDFSEPKKNLKKEATDFFTHTVTYHLTSPHRALLVGVFRNQPLAHVLAQQRLLDLDLVQLHGDEPTEWASAIPVPVIKSFKTASRGIGKRGYHAMPLLDAGSGGSGQTLDLGELQQCLSKDDNLTVMLAGGLRPENVRERLEALGPLRQKVCGVDVSSGVEEDGKQSLEKIRAFIAAVKKPSNRPKT